VPIAFVTQAPVAGTDFTAITATFGHHQPQSSLAPRGGDLWIAYPTANGNVELRNLTAEAGFGMVDGRSSLLPGSQSLTKQTGPFAIAVRDPAVHWDASKLLVSMVVGDAESSRWQIYEVTGLARGQSVQFNRLAGQPAQYNNINAIYDSRSRIVFASDMPRSGPGMQHAHLFPQLDEYEEQPTVSGLWRLDTSSGEVELLHHAPSGAFRPSVDSYGRIVFTNWDHLQRDQQASNPLGLGLFNYRDENASAVRERIDGSAAQTLVKEQFPEPHPATPNGGNALAKHRFNSFLPWMIHQDGTQAETLNHIGRHELGIFSSAARAGLGLSDINGASGINATLTNQGYKIDAYHFLREDPFKPGEYLAVVAPEFGTHGGGMIVRLLGAPKVKPQDMKVTLLTPYSTRNAGGPALYRSPMASEGGRLLASVSTVTNTAAAGVRYNYRLYWLKQEGNFYSADTSAPLTAGLSKRLGSLIAEALWELDPVELRARPVPADTVMPSLASPEQQVFSSAGVDVQEFTQFLRTNKLALIVSRNVTSRDGFDRQQPFNLRISRAKPDGTFTQTVTGNAPVWEIDHLQIFQADQLRGIRGLDDAGNTTLSDPRRGRRVLPQPMHGDKTLSGKAANPAAPNGPAGAVRLGADGSMAALVPAQRALTWQLVKGKEGDPQTGTDGIVRERVWVSFQPGEIRVCASCHGVSEKDQANRLEPLNPPDALRELLQHYKAQLR
jgi:hypothetical protein